MGTRVWVPLGGMEGLVGGSGGSVGSSSSAYSKGLVDWKDVVEVVDSCERTFSMDPDGRGMRGRGRVEGGFGDDVLDVGRDKRAVW